MATVVDLDALRRNIILIGLDCSAITTEVDGRRYLWAQGETISVAVFEDGDIHVENCKPVKFREHADRILRWLIDSNTHPTPVTAP